MKIEKRDFNIKPSSINHEERTVEVVWTSGAKVERRGYIEELVVNSESVDLSRLNAGAPLLNSHRSGDLQDVVGVVDSAWLKNGKGYALVRFSERAKEIWQDVKEGIIRNISVGYSIEEVEEIQNDESLIVRATKWTPFELSLVPVPADAAAQTRNAEVLEKEEIKEEVSEEEIDPIILEAIEEIENQDHEILEALADDTTGEVVEAQEEAPTVEEDSLTDCGDSSDVAETVAEQEEEAAALEVPTEVADAHTEAQDNTDDTVVAHKEVPEAIEGTDEVKDSEPYTADPVAAVRLFVSEIVKRCVDNGIADYAPDFIADGLTLQQVDERIETLSEIRGICKRAGYSDLADDFIKEKRTIEEVRAELLEKLVSNDSVEINSRFNSVAEDEALAKQQKLARSLSPAAIYKKLNQK